MFFRKNKQRSNFGSVEEQKKLKSTSGPGNKSSNSSLQTSNGSPNNRSADKLLGANQTRSIDLIDDIETNNDLEIQERQSFINPSKNLDKILIDDALNKSNSNLNKISKPTLARAETVEENHNNGNIHNSDYSNINKNDNSKQQQSCKAMLMFRMLIKKWPILIILLILSCMAAIYCIPFVEIEPKTPKRLPNIPFDFKRGPLKESDVTKYRAELLFYNQLHGAESIALDSQGNMFMAIEGGFILYAHLNNTTPPNRYFIDNKTATLNSDILFDEPNGQILPSSSGWPTTTRSVRNLIKIAELNPIKQLTPEQRRREQAINPDYNHQESGWRRECQLDDQVYGKNLWSMINPLTEVENMIDNDSNEKPNHQEKHSPKFHSKVIMSRCSKPLGVRLSPDENYLYVVDTLSGLYRVHLKISERPNSRQRLVSKLVDFRHQRRHLLPVTFLDLATSQQQQRQPSENSKQLESAGSPISSSLFSSNMQSNAKSLRRIIRQNNNAIINEPSFKVRTYLNTSLMAVDDLVIDYGAGTRGGDMIYMTVASQRWVAVGFLYDYVEGRPSGAIIRYDTGANHLSVLSPSQVSHVRTSMTGKQLWFAPSGTGAEQGPPSYQWYNDINDNHLEQEDVIAFPPPQQSTTNMVTYVDRMSENYSAVVLGPGMSPLSYGAPRLDENDIFDDRALHFPNGLELTDDKQALLIADTANKRIIKHFIRGPRKGTSDLWAWTPNFPDNIRRGFEKNRETYWVAGCGEDTSDKFDIMSWLHSWPRIRKYFLKNIYLFGWLVETIGSNLIKSTRVRDFGFAIKTGHSLCRQMCVGMMVLQYNAHGELIRSIHSKEFPQDLVFYSQVNEVIDSHNNEHFLYLSSPSYNYVTKLYLPSQEIPSIIEPIKIDM